MTTYAIEKNVPTPMPSNYGRKYPFHQMEVGDSFPCEKRDVAKIRVAAVNWGRRNEKAFVVRSDEGAGRCWRIK